jgi:hypothetical protein
MKKVFLMFLVSLCCGIIVFVLWTGKASAQPFPGGLPKCEASLNSCNADLDACEAQTTAQVPQTGQTTCWDPADTMAPIDEIVCSNAAAQGEDGQVLAGVVPPNPRFTDNGNGTITDNLTGLIWLKNSNCFGIRTWAQALTDANTLNSGECSLSDGSVAGDWYLPNRNQLTSLLDLENDDPALPTGHPFMNFQSSVYWSSTTFANGPSSAWDVSFSSGFVDFRNKFNSFFVTAVRGGS